MESTRALPQNPVLLIPARLTSARLMGKVLADLGGTPMIVHVLKAAQKSGLGPVVVACAEQEIADVVTKVGGTAVLTDPACPTGSDRISQALAKIDPDKKFDAVINVQGDVPMLEPELIKKAFGILQNPAVDIGTLVTKIKNREELESPQIVKAIVVIKPGEKSGQALSFTRSPMPPDKGTAYHHIGLYAYRRAALEAFVNAPQSGSEKRESLEQLRALDLGLRIDAALVDTVSFGIDTPDDLERARRIMAGNP
jgi:3-deoxy-manno-octulosonate cytidylyltransferase (CMP-KDO synthetase)